MLSAAPPDVRCVPLHACIYGGPRTSSIEILWVAITVVALVLQLFLLRAAVRRQQAVAAAGLDGTRRRYLWGIVRVKILLASVQALFLFVGIWAAATPAPLLRVANDRAQGSVVLLILAELGLFGVALAQSADARWMRETIERSDRKEAT